MTAPPFRHTYRVPYAHCTMGNHVYYARYLEMLEVARNELFRQAGQPFSFWQERDVIFPVIDCHLRYQGAARYDELLTIEVWVSHARGIRLGLGYRILNEAGRTLVTAETLHVCASTRDKPRRLPEELVRALQPYVAALGPGAA